MAFPQAGESGRHRNDDSDQLEPLFTENVWLQHGDVSIAKKKKAPELTWDRS